MRSSRARLCLSVAVLAFSVEVNAADDPARNPANETVQVSGSRPAVQTLPDRQVYSITHDLQSSNGTLVDVLRNLPSVDVDVAGNVSLRGDSNVTILIDGKPSALLSGDRGEALEQIPADSIDRIEVMTSPGAQYKAQGSGGIINIISKKKNEDDRSVTLRASVGNDGRYVASASGTAALDPVRLSGAAAVRRDVRYRTGSDVRSGKGGASRQESSSKSPRSVVMAKFGADAEWNEANSLEAAVNFSHRTSWNNSQEYNYTAGAAAYHRLGAGPGRRDALQSSLEYTRTFAKGQELKLEIGQGYDWEYKRIDYRDVFSSSPDTADWQQERSIEMETEAGASYKMAFANGMTLKSGYSYEGANNAYLNTAMVRDPVTALWHVDGDFTSHFKLYEGLHALYTSFETKVGAFNVEAGLRGEYLDIATRLITTGAANERVYRNLFPSLHIGYALTGTDKLNIGYTRRENIPDDDDLNPVREYRSALSVEGGNADLKPEITDSLEAAFHHVGEADDLMFTVYHRRTHNGFTEVSKMLADGVLLTTKDNLARRTATGFELAENGDLASSLSYRSSANLAYTEIDPGVLSTGRKRSGLAIGGKAGLDLKPTADDTFQVSVNYAARRFLPQGNELPLMTASAAWRHTFSPQLAAVVSVNNMFDSQKRKTILDTVGTHDEAISRLPGRIVFFGLTYNVGGAKQDEPAAEAGEGE